MKWHINYFNVECVTISHSSSAGTQWLLSNWTLLWEQCHEAATETMRRMRSEINYYVEQWLSSYVPMCSLHCVHQHLQSGDQHWVLSANDEGAEINRHALFLLHQLLYSLMSSSYQDAPWFLSRWSQWCTWARLNTVSACSSTMQYYSTSLEWDTKWEWIWI